MAAQEFAIVKRQNPQLPGIDKQLGLALFHSKENEQAIPLLTQARTLDPDDIQVLLALGTCLCQSRQGRKSARQFSQTF